MKMQRIYLNDDSDNNQQLLVNGHLKLSASPNVHLEFQVLALGCQSYPSKDYTVAIDSV